MYELRILRILWNTDEGAGGTTTTTTETTTETDAPFKTFATEEEFNKVIKSETSKAKHAVLQEIGVKSIQEVKDALTQAETFKLKATELETKHRQTEEELAVVSMNIKPELREEALTLARAKKDMPLNDALKAVVEKMPHFASVQRKVQALGGDRQEQHTDSTVSDKLKNKYAFLK